MTIISLLLVLLVERVTTKSQYWQFEFYFNKLVKAYHPTSLCRLHFSATTGRWID